MNRFSRLAIAGVATAALIVAVAPAASAEIVPNVGMKGIKLDQKKKTVVRKLGAPKWVEKGTNDFGKFQVLHYRHKFTVNLENKFVVAMTTKSTGQRTSTGVGVGSTKGQVQAGVPGVICETISGHKSCHLGDLTNPGEAVTDFQLKQNKVKAVVIGRLLD